MTGYDQHPAPKFFLDTPFIYTGELGLVVEKRISLYFYIPVDRMQDRQMVGWYMDCNYLPSTVT